MVKKLLLTAKLFSFLSLFLFFPASFCSEIKKNVDIAAIVSNFKDICKDQHGLALLSASTEALIDSAFDQIVTLVQHKEGARILRTIIPIISTGKSKKNYFKKITNIVDNNFIEICTAPYGLGIIYKLLRSAPEIGDLHLVCFSNVVKNLELLMLDDRFLNHKKRFDLCHEICYVADHKIKKLTESAPEFFKKLVSTHKHYSVKAIEFAIQILQRLLDKEKPESQILCAKLLCQSDALFQLDAHFLDAIKDYEASCYIFNVLIKDIPRASEKNPLIDFIIWFIKDKKEYQKLLVQQINNNLLAIAQAPFGYLLLKNCVFNNALVISKLQKAIVEAIETVHPQIILLINEYSTDVTSLKKALKRYLKHHKTVDGLVKMWLYNSSCIDESEKICYGSQSPTEHHLKHFNPQESDSYYNSVSYLLDTLSTYQKEPMLQAMVIEVIEKEKELHQKYYTFIHGQRLHYLFFEQLHTFLCQKLNKVHIDNFLFLHIKHIKQTPEDLKKEKQQRKAILKDGRKTNNDRKKLLFVNRAFFGNLTNLGSCSANYISNNNNVGNIDLTLKKIFSINNLKELYSKYKIELKSLYKKFNELSKYGACILIAVPKESAQKQIYTAFPGGYKRTIWLKDIFGLSWRWTNDVKYLFDLLHTNPSKIGDIDQIEFCIPMTADTYGGLNPESGIKMFPFIATDSQKLADYYQEQHELFERIKKDIEVQMIVS